MNTSALSFPTIAHLPGSTLHDDDVALDLEELPHFLEERVYVFEKLDGVNVRVFAHRGGATWSVKPKWASAVRATIAPAIEIWVRQREEAILAALPAGGAFTVEWVRTSLHVEYDRLPAPAMGIALEDRHGAFLPWREASARITAAGIAINPPVFHGVLGDMTTVRRLVRRSQFSRARMEGVVVEREEGAPRWAKWVRAGYEAPRPQDVDPRRRNRLA